MTAALFALAAGVVAGGTVASWWSRRASAAPRPDVSRASQRRERVITPVSALLGDETREMQAQADAHFATLAFKLLDDVRTQHGARAAGIWRLRDRVPELQLAVGDEAFLHGMADTVLPMLRWTAEAGVVQLGPDSEAPRAGVAPLGSATFRPDGVLALLFAQPPAGDRAELKEWLRRHGERIGLVREIVHTHGELAKMNRRTRLLLRETQSWDVEERPHDLGARLCAMVESLTGADGAALVRWNDDARTGTVVVADGSCAQFAGSAVDEDSLAGAVCREDVPQIWHEVSGRGEGPEALFTRSLPTQTGCVLVQPLRRKGAVIGAVVAAHRLAGALGAAELRALSLFDAVASFRLATAWKIEEVARRALVDGLTGLANRAGFETEMRSALSEHMRFGWEVSLVLVDVDHFKGVNDTYGHEAGDAVLRSIASVLQDGVRGTDVCARVGGEEMALILKDTGVQGARELAERLRVAVEGLRVPWEGDSVSVTASFGVATYPSEVPEWDALYRAADRALYDAKAAGRNQVRGKA